MSVNETSALSLWISLAAVIVGPVVSLKISKRQLIAPMRQKWIDEVRELMSEILSECQKVIVMREGQGLLDDAKSDEALFQKLLYLETKLGLMLNPTEDEHINLLKSINNLTEAAHHGVGNFMDFGANVSHVTELTQRVLKIEWQRVAGKKSWIDAWI